MRQLFKLFSIAALGFAPPSYAGVTQINITCVQSPTFGGASFGSVGQYELLQGPFTGVVDPFNTQNAVIVDIRNAPRNARGMVTYSADFQILRPVNLSQGNHRVIFDLPNRGGATSLSTFNNGTSNDKSWCTSGLPSNFTVGDGFLMNHGFTVVETAWDITVTPSGSSAPSFGVTFPVARNRDGSSITGPSTEEFDIDFSAKPATQPLHYAAATADQSKATLTVRENYADAPIVIPSSGWAYTDSTLTAIQLTGGLVFGGPGTYSPTALYEFTYTAKDPLVAGLGFAALRDFATFLRTAKSDDHEHSANPLAGDVQAIYTTCVSQPCRTTRDFVLLGFNQPELSRGHADSDSPRSAH